MYTHCTRCKAPIPTAYYKDDQDPAADSIRRDLCYPCFERLLADELDTENKKGCLAALAGLALLVLFLLWVTSPKSGSVPLNGYARPQSVSELDWLQARGYFCQRQADNQYHCIR